MTLAPLLLQVLIIAPPLSRRSLAQKPPAPSDSVPRDSQPQKPIGFGCEMCLGAAVAAFGAVELIAPPVLLLLPKLTDLAPGALSDHHVSVYITGGDGARFRNGIDRWAYTEDIEVFTHGIYAEVRSENFYTPGHFQFHTLRTGYLAHPKPALLGGVTLGYRTAHGALGQDALEIGLPSAVGNERGAVRFEPTYVISKEGVSWNYRLQMELYVPSRHLVTGVAFEAKPLQQGGPYYGTMALLLGVRF